MSNFTTIQTASQALNFTVLSSEIGEHTILLRGDSTPQYNAAAAVDAKHAALSAAGRDLDGRVTHQASKPLSTKAQMKRLQKSSARLSSAMDRMLEF